MTIKVSFSGHGEVHMLKSLSGGQKSVVALAFIFAIQVCRHLPSSRVAVRRLLLPFVFNILCFCASFKYR